MYNFLSVTITSISNGVMLQISHDGAYPGKQIYFKDIGELLDALVGNVCESWEDMQKRPPFEPAGIGATLGAEPYTPSLNEQKQGERLAECDIQESLHQRGVQSWKDKLYGPEGQMQSQEVVRPQLPEPTPFEKYKQDHPDDYRNFKATTPKPLHLRPEDIVPDDKQ